MLEILTLVRLILMVMVTCLCVQAVLTVFTATVELHAEIVQTTRRVTRPRDVVPVDVRSVISHTFAMQVSVV